MSNKKTTCGNENDHDHVDEANAVFLWTHAFCMCVPMKISTNTDTISKFDDISCKSVNFLRNSSIFKRITCKNNDAVSISCIIIISDSILLHAVSLCINFMMGLSVLSGRFWYSVKSKDNYQRKEEKLTFPLHRNRAINMSAYTLTYDFFQEIKKEWK